MAGFFSLGEFGKLDDSRPEFHGTTVSWVALKEKYNLKPHAIKFDQKYSQRKRNRGKDQTMKAEFTITPVACYKIIINYESKINHRKIT